MVQAGADRDGKFHVAAIVWDGVRVRGRAQIPPPWLWKAAHGAQPGSGRLLFVRFLSAWSSYSLPTVAGRGPGYRQDRSHSTVLPVMQLQGMRVNGQEMHREESTAGDNSVSKECSTKR